VSSGIVFEKRPTAALLSPSALASLIRALSLPPAGRVTVYEFQVSGYPGPSTLSHESLIFVLFPWWQIPNLITGLVTRYVVGTQLMS